MTRVDLDAIEVKRMLPSQRPLVEALVAELRAARERYGKDGEVWCGACRDQGGTAYCVEMAGHERDGVPHLWKAATS